MLWLEFFYSLLFCVNLSVVENCILISARAENVIQNLLPSSPIVEE